jgi:hypothetical protein
MYQAMKGPGEDVVVVAGMSKVHTQQQTSDGSKSMQMVARGTVHCMQAIRHGGAPSIMAMQWRQCTAV